MTYPTPLDTVPAVIVSMASGLVEYWLFDGFLGVTCIY